jgi:hypothetical protein
MSTVKTCSIPKSFAESITMAANGACSSQLASNLLPGSIFHLVTRPLINLEEKFDKIVGRRTQTPDAFKNGMQLQTLAVQLHRSLGHR